MGLTNNEDQETQDEDTRSQKLITENLKRVFQEDAEQDIPDHLKEFIARLEQSDSEGGDNK